MTMHSSFLMRTLRYSVGFLTGLAALLPLGAANLPPHTTLPVVFTHALDAKKARQGEAVTAEIMQTVVLPGGKQIPKGSLLLGHVVAANAFHFDETPYAAQQPSALEIHFDSLREDGQQTPVFVSVRALANSVESWRAEAPHYLDESDHVGTMELIGGGQYSPLDKKVVSDDQGDIIGYNKKQGVYARLLPADYNDNKGTHHCEGTQTEQAVGIFSPGACGIYGFSTVWLSQNDADGTFRLASTHGSVKLYAGSTALIEVQPSR